MLSKTIISIHHIYYTSIFHLHLHLLLACIFYLNFLTLFNNIFLLVYLMFGWLFGHLLLLFNLVGVHILWLLDLNDVLLYLNGSLVVEWLVGCFIFIGMSSFNWSLYTLLTFKAWPYLIIYRCSLILQGFQSIFLGSFHQQLKIEGSTTMLIDAS